MFTAFMVALTMTAAANVLVTMAAGPLITAVFARISIGHRRRRALAPSPGRAGIAWMYGGRHDRRRSWGRGTRSPCGAGGRPINWTVVQEAQARGPVDLAPAVLIGAVARPPVTLPWAWPLAATAHDLALLALLGTVQLAIPWGLLMQRALRARRDPGGGLAGFAGGDLRHRSGLGRRAKPTRLVLPGGALVIGPGRQRIARLRGPRGDRHRITSRRRLPRCAAAWAASRCNVCRR